MNVIDAVKSRRSIRAYRKGPVPQAALDDMLEAARLAPSWKNNQSFSYILVQDRQLIGQLGEITGYNPSQSAYENAEYFLVLCGDPTLSGRREEKEYDTLRQNVEALLEKPREAEPQRQRNHELE